MIKTFFLLIFFAIKPSWSFVTVNDCHQNNQFENFITNAEDLLFELGTIECYPDGFSNLGPQLKETIVAAIQSLPSQRGYSYTGWKDLESFQFCARQGEKMIECRSISPTQDGSFAQWNSVTKLFFYQFLQENKYLNHYIDFVVLEGSKNCGISGMGHPSLTLEKLRSDGHCEGKNICILTDASGNLKDTTIRHSSLDKVYGALRNNSEADQRKKYTKKLIENGIVESCGKEISNSLKTDWFVPSRKRPYKVKDVMPDILSNSDGNAITALEEIFEDDYYSAKKINIKEKFRSYLQKMGITNRNTHPTRGGMQASCSTILNNTRILNDCDDQLVPHVKDTSNRDLFYNANSQADVYYKSGSNSPAGEIAGVGASCLKKQYRGWFQNPDPLLFAFHIDLKDHPGRAYSPETLPDDRIPDAHLFGPVRRVLLGVQGTVPWAFKNSGGSFDKFINLMGGTKINNPAENGNTNNQGSYHTGFDSVQSEDIFYFKINTGEYAIENETKCGNVKGGVWFNEGRIVTRDALNSWGLDNKEINCLITYSKIEFINPSSCNPNYIYETAPNVLLGVSSISKLCNVNLKDEEIYLSLGKKYSTNDYFRNPSNHPPYYFSENICECLVQYGKVLFSGLFAN